MREAIVTFFGTYAATVVFVHVLSAVVWIGGMIAVRVAVHPSLQRIEEPALRLETTLRIVGRLFHLVLPFILLLIATAVVLSIGLQLKNTPLSYLVHLKEAIWTIMTLNYAYMYLRRKRAADAFARGDLAGAGRWLRPLPALLLPINIVLGIVAIFAGVVLRGV